MNETKATVRVSSPEMAASLGGVIQLLENTTTYGVELMGEDFKLAARVADLRHSLALVEALRNELVRNIQELETRQRGIANAGRNYRY